MKNNKKIFVSPELTICDFLETKDVITASGLVDGGTADNVNNIGSGDLDYAAW